MQWLYILLCAYQFIYKYRCLKAKVIKTNFLGNDMPKNKHYTCIAYKNYLQLYLKSLNIEPKNTNVQIHKNWIKIRFRFRAIRFRVRKVIFVFLLQLIKLYLKMHFLREHFKYALMFWLLIYDYFMIICNCL